MVVAVTSPVALDAKAAENVLHRLISKPDKASPELLKHPHISTHSSWHLWLPPHFNTSLDLRYVDKQQVKDKVVVRKWKEWRQGSSFCFNEGAIIYDRDVSACRTWGEKLDAIDFYVVVGKTRPVKSLRLPSGTGRLGRLTRDPGLVAYRIYVPNGRGSSIEDENIVTQDGFVRFAISGI